MNMLSKQEYVDFVKEKSPKSPMWRSMLAAFFVGGLICCVGEGVSDLLKLIFPAMTEEDVATWTTVVMIFAGSFLTAIGVYDKLGHFAGGGSIIPITGFANSVVSPAVEYNREGVFFGVCAKMFVIAGPIIVFGIVASVIVGIIGLFL